MEDFDIDLEAQVATCPAGRPSRRWLPTPGNIDNRVAIHIFFGKQCLACPFFGVDRCTNSKGGRHLSLNAFHEIIQARRKEEQTEPFQQELRALAALEGPISEMVRAYALRRARYRGTLKVFLQMLLTATATNLKRLTRTSACLLASFDPDLWSSLVLRPFAA